MMTWIGHISVISPGHDGTWIGMWIGTWGGVESRLRKDGMKWERRGLH
jgi:hypothetical protein